ncbi:MAG: hypothetical protein H7Z40_01490 [Phycisphaerae bacterium]|nr:hypothetical protein [Gemmatimonadaceae bacterium]
MIYFAVDSSGKTGGMERYLANRGVALGGHITPIVYEDVFQLGELPGGTWIFSSIDLLTPSARRMAAHVHQRLRETGHLTLNDPVHSLRRYELLTALYDAGVNEFRAVRASDYRGDLRFPVFVRNDLRHDGNLSGLLHSDRDVRRELLSARFRGHALDQLLVVEFCDLSQDGWFRKYSAFRIGDRILGRHAQSSRHWMVKSDTGVRTDWAAEFERQYIDENPHAAQLAYFFDLANIQYGRIDYGLRNGRVQLWEINTTPTIGAGSSAKKRSAEDERYRELREPAVRGFHERFRDAFFSIDEQGPAPAVPITLDPVLRESAQHEQAALRQRAVRVKRLHRLAQHPALVQLRRSVETVLRKVVGR